jgi:adenylyltransferase/sulfurtransferase
VPSGQEGTCIHYRDLFPHPPKEGEVLNCAESGVLGVLPGIIGSLMANEAIKLLTGLGKPLSGRLLTYNALTNDTMQWDLSKRADSDDLVPTTVAELHKRDYNWECGIANNNLEIGLKELEELIATEPVKLIDVREVHEVPLLQRWPHEQIPLGQLMQAESFDSAETVVFICQSGKRSLTAANWAKGKNEGVKFLSLRGGVLGLE